MKNKLFNLALAIALIFGINPSIFCQTVTASDAEKAAINFMKTQNPQARILASHGTATSAENQKEVLVHIFNFQPGGFVLVAGDLKSTPILGFSDKNNFDLEHINPETGFYLGEIKDQISILKKDKNLAPMLASWDKCLKDTGTNGGESEITVGPYLATKWDQGLYYNQLCPADNMGPGGHAVTGCVATAMAQLIKYHNSPAYGKGYNQYFHPNYGWQVADFENTHYNWNNMPNALTSANTDVATLMYQCGVSVNMNYGTSVSYAFGSDVAAALKNYFSFSDAMQWTTNFGLGLINFLPIVKADLDLGHPIFMTGCSTGSCHAWMCDGYKIITGTPVYYSMNWGWGGNSDGYYMLGSFNPGNYAFNSQISALTGIEPRCPRNVNLTTPIVAGFPTEVIETITANAVVTPSIPALGNHVDYDAGKCIQMNPGFKADGNTVVFRAFIQGCGGPTPFSNGENGERSEQKESLIEPSQENMALNVYPNPFSDYATIAYQLPADQTVDIQIYSATGTLVAEPVRQEQQETGKHEYNFEANGLPNGVYFLVMQAEGKKWSKQLVLAR